MTIEEKLDALRAEAAPRKSVEELVNAVADLTARLSKVEKKLKALRG